MAEKKEEVQQTWRTMAGEGWGNPPVLSSIVSVRRGLCWQS